MLCFFYILFFYMDIIYSIKLILHSLNINLAAMTNENGIFLGIGKRRGIMIWDRNKKY